MATRHDPATATFRLPPMGLYETILVPLDGSPFAEAALRPAAELATRAGATVHLASALHDEGGELVPVDLPVPPEHDRPLREVAALERYLGEVSDRLEQEWECRVETEVLGDTTVVDVLVDHAERIGADLMVAATHARGAMLRTLLGSTAADFVHRAPCPVLLIPSAEPQPDEDTPLQGEVARVVAALDPSGDSDLPVVSHAFEWARLWDATIDLVEVVLASPLPDDATLAMSPGAGATMDVENARIVEGRLERIAEELRTRGADVRVEVPVGTRAADTIVEHVESNAADLVIAGRHERGFVERVVLGSESDRLIRRLRSVGILVCPLEARQPNG